MSHAHLPHHPILQVPFTNRYRYYITTGTVDLTDTEVVSVGFINLLFDTNGKKSSHTTATANNLIWKQFSQEIIPEVEHLQIQEIRYFLFGFMRHFL